MCVCMCVYVRVSVCVFSNMLDIRMVIGIGEGFFFFKTYSLCSEAVLFVKRDS